MAALVALPRHAAPPLVAAQSHPLLTTSAGYVSYFRPALLHFLSTSISLQEEPVAGRSMWRRRREHVAVVAPNDH
jgi:hypothetical protein